VDHDGVCQSRAAMMYARPEGVVRRAAAGTSSSETIIAGGRANGLPPDVAKMRIVPQKEDETDVDGHIEGLQGATT
jgi:hypothetical protein